jgi:hypothetical protein
MSPRQARTYNRLPAPLRVVMLVLLDLWDVITFGRSW